MPKSIDIFYSPDQDQYAIYLDGLFEETIYLLTTEDFLAYGADEYMQLRVANANEALEAYLDIHGDWPGTIRQVRNVMEA